MRRVRRGYSAPAPSGGGAPRPPWVHAAPGAAVAPGGRPFPRNAARALVGRYGRRWRGAAGPWREPARSPGAPPSRRDAAHAARASHLVPTRSKKGWRARPIPSPWTPSGTLCVTFCVTLTSPIAELPCFLGKTQKYRGVRFPPAPLFKGCAPGCTEAQPFAFGPLARGRQGRRSFDLQRRVRPCRRRLRQCLRRLLPCHPRHHPVRFGQGGVPRAHGDRAPEPLSGGPPAPPRNHLPSSHIAISTGHPCTHHFEKSTRGGKNRIKRFALGGFLVFWRLWHTAHE